MSAGFYGEFLKRFPYLEDATAFAEQDASGACPQRALLQRSLRFVTLLLLSYASQRRLVTVESARLMDENLKDLNEAACVRIQNGMLQRQPQIVAEVFGLPLRHPTQMRLFFEAYRALLLRLESLQKSSRSDEAVTALAEDYSQFLFRHFHSHVVVAARSTEPMLLDIANGEELPMEGKFVPAAGALYLVDDMASVFTALSPLVLFRERQLFLFAGLGDEGVLYEGPERTPLNRRDREELLGWVETLIRLGACRQALTVFHVCGRGLFPNKERTRLYRYARTMASAMDLLREEEHDRAREELERVLPMDEENPLLHYGIALCFHRQGQTNEAIAALRRFMAREPERLETMEFLGDLFAEKNGAEALKFYERVASSGCRPDISGRMENIRRSLAAASPASAAPSPMDFPQEREAPSSDDLLIDMLEEAQAGRYALVVGCEAERRQMVEILCCQAKNNVLIVGDPGVGKTALVQDLALRIVKGEVPAMLQDRRLLSLNAAAAIAGAKYRGQFEERVLQMMKDLRRQPAILFIDDIQALSGVGLSKGGSLDFSTLVKPALLRGEFQAVATAPYEEFRARLEKDATLMRCFQTVRREAPSLEETADIVAFRKQSLETHHGVTLSEELVRETLAVIDLCVKDRAFPDKALDVYDRAAAKAALRREGRVRLEDVQQAVADISSLPAGRVAALRDKRYEDLAERLQRRIIGQDLPIAQVARTMRTAKLNFRLRQNRPEAVFLFVGPTGVGKTELARAMAEELYGDAERLVRIDMSEYMERISSSRLIGTAPGYVGYNDANQLTDMVRRNPYSLVLLDEIEKADPQVLNLFLQVFDSGRLTDGRGRTAYFHHTSIVMTGNIATQVYSQARIGYDDAMSERAQSAEVLKQVRKFFPPEFFNRIDEVVAFLPLRPEHIRRIADLKLEGVRKRLAESGKHLEISDPLYGRLVREGYSHEHGARHLERVLRRLVLDPMAEASLNPEWDEAERVAVSEGGDGKILVSLDSGEPVIEAAVLSDEQAWDGRD